MRALWLTLLLALCGWPPATAAQTGRGVPQRVVSLDMCTDWMLAVHASPSQVAALSPMGRRFGTGHGLAVDWPLHDGSLEQIIALQPDRIIVGPYNATGLRRRLQALGHTVDVTPLPTSLDGVLAFERTMLSLLGQPSSRSRLPDPRPPLDSAAPRLLVLGANGVGTGVGTFESEVIERAGWRNYLTRSGYVRLDMEAVVADPPEAILWAAPVSPARANAFAEHRALRRVVPPPRWLHTDNWRWECPGPWTWDLVDQLRQWREEWR